MSLIKRNSRNRWMCYAVSLVMATTALQGVQSTVKPQPVQAAEPIVTSAADESSAMAAAKRQNTPVMVESLTTQIQTVSANPDNTFTAKIDAIPERVQTADGSWAQIDTDLIRSGKWYAPKVPGNDVAVSAGGKNKTIAQVTVPATQLPQLAAAVNSVAAASKVQLGFGTAPQSGPQPSIGLKWKKRLPAPAIAGDTATYSNAGPGIDLNVGVDQSSFSPEFVIRKKMKKKLTLTLPVSLKMLKLKPWKKGGFAITTTAGQVVSRTGPTVVQDMNSINDESGPALYKSLRYTVKKNSLSVTIPRSVMRSKTAVFPLHVAIASKILPAKITTYTYSKDDERNKAHDGDVVIKTGTNDQPNTAHGFIFFDPSVTFGKVVTKAQMFVWANHGTGCSAPPFQVWGTQTAWKSDITWKDERSLQLNGPWSTYYPNEGASGCPDGYVGGGPPGGGVDITQMAQRWALGAIPVHGVRLGLQNDGNHFWSVLDSRIGTHGPSLWVTWANLPATPTNPSILPFQNGYTNSTTPYFGAQVHQSDPGIGGPQAAVYVFEDGNDNPIWSGVSNPVFPEWDAYVHVAPGVLQDGHKYFFRAYGYLDGVQSASYVQSPDVTVDTKAPFQPTVIASGVSDNGWNTSLPSNNTFTFIGSPDDGDLASFQVAQDGVVLSQNVDADAHQRGSLQWAPQAGWHTLQVWAVDKAGNLSTPATFSFGSGPAAFTKPGIEQRSAQFFPLAAAVDGDASAAAISWKESGSTTWNPAPDGSLLINGSNWDGNLVAAGPGKALPPGLTFDAGFEKVNEDDPTPRPHAPSVLNLRVCFTVSGNQVCSQGDQVNVQYVSHAFGGNFATAPVGPGQVSLSTGELSVPVTDATIPGTDVSVGRNWLSNAADTADGLDLFGPGWQESVPAPASGALASKIVDDSQHGQIFVISPSGATDVFVNQAGTGPGTYVGAGLTAATGAQITLTSSTLVLQDASGTQSTWTTTGDAVWVPHMVELPRQQGKIRVESDATASNVGTYRNAITGRFNNGSGEAAWCADLPTTAQAKAVRGCQVMELAITPTGTSPSDGNYPGRASSIAITMWDPDAHEPAMTTLTYAKYSYDPSTGFLASAWNPQLATTAGDLVAKYTYDTVGSVVRLTSASPASALDGGTPYLKPYTYSYDTPLNRVVASSRVTPQGDNATTSVSYGVDLSGDGLPDLTTDATKTWNQSALESPSGAVAVFYPDSSHAASNPDDIDPSDWQYADITYLNNVGAATNTASFGAGQWLISTTEYNSDGYVSSTLSAANRALALQQGQCTAPAAVCTQGTTDAKARLLSSITQYNNPELKGSPTDTWSPAFDGIVNDLQTTTDSGKRTIQTHVHTVYNEGAPNGSQYTGMALATTITQGAAIVNGIDGEPDHDLKKTTIGYGTPLGGTLGWDLRKATQSTVIPGGSADPITTTTAFNAEGNPTVSKMPASNGNDAGTTRSFYYNAATSTGCPSSDARPEWDGLLCASAVAGQPDGPPVPNSSITAYTVRQQTERTVDTSGAVTRTTTNQYDSVSGRLMTTSITSNNPDDVSIPDTMLSYDPKTGAVQTTKFAGTDPRTISQAYDTWGRVISYTDASGVTSQTSYQSDGLVSSVDDGKGTYHYTYDNNNPDAGPVEHRGLVTSMTTGMASGIPDRITAQYAPSGGPSQVGYANGVSATFATDPVGHLSGKAYAIGDKPLISWTQLYNSGGQLSYDFDSLAGSRRMDYDNAGRLIQVDDNRSGSCIANTYGFNANSDRTTKTMAKADDSACVLPAANSTPAAHADPITTWRNQFDSADRQTDTVVTGSGAGTGNYTYDNLGRTRKLPSIDNTSGTDISLTYYADDTVAGQTVAGGGQNTIMKWDIDPAGRQYNLNVRGGANSGTVLNHYAGSSDSPSWMAMTLGKNSMIRNVRGPGGSLAIQETVSNAGESSADLQIINPHGDIESTIPMVTDVAPDKMSKLTLTDEYGVPLEGSEASSPYGWLGAAMRSNLDLGGLIQMGARNYNPATGRFLSKDPLPGGNANVYTYPVDPLNSIDLSGKFGWDWVGTFVQAVVSYAALFVPVIWVVPFVARQVYKAVVTSANKAAQAIAPTIPKFKKAAVKAAVAIADPKVPTTVIFGAASLYVPVSGAVCVVRCLE